MRGKVVVLGVGADGAASLLPPARALVDEAELLVGGQRQLALFPTSKAERLVLQGDLAGVLRRIAEQAKKRRVVVLASGDPGFFGIGKLLARELGKERVEIVPNLSSVQLAFARLKESWEDATLLSAHGRSLAALAPAVRRSDKVAILGDAAHSPAAIARALLAAGLGGYRAHLCEDLGTAQERVRSFALAELAAVEASGLFVLVLLRAEGRSGRRSWSPGIADDEFHQRRPRGGLITKAEVRVVSLARLAPDETSIVWDVGAGCGSVAVEAALIAWRGEVYAVERGAEDVALIRQNVAKFGTANLTVVHGTAPEALAPLPDPDAVFVGGSGGQLAAILEVVSRRLRAGGRVVVNAATIETALSAQQGLRERGFAVEATLLQVSRSRDLGGLTHFRALDPVFVVAGRRPGDVALTPPSPCARERETIPSPRSRREGEG